MLCGGGVWSYVVVLIHQPCIFMRVRRTPSLLASTSSSDTPPIPSPPVRTATVSHSAFILQTEKKKYAQDRQKRWARVRIGFFVVQFLATGRLLLCVRMSTLTLR